MSTNVHQPHRRSVLKGAAWAAPAIVVATAAPALAASADALVTINIPTTANNGTNLPVQVTFTNVNTRSTGQTDLAIVFTPGVGQGSVDADAPAFTTNDAGWTNQGNTLNTLTGARTFNFRSTTGIPGAATVTGTAVSTLVFQVKVTQANGASSGGISASATPARGSVLPFLTGSWT